MNFPCLEYQAGNLLTSPTVAFFFVMIFQACTILYFGCSIFLSSITSWGGKMHAQLGKGLVNDLALNLPFIWPEAWYRSLSCCMKFPQCDSIHVSVNWQNIYVDLWIHSAATICYHKFPVCSIYHQISIHNKFRAIWLILILKLRLKW